MAKPRISASIPEDIDNKIEQLVQDDDNSIETKSDAIRHLLRRGLESDELQSKLETREDRVEQLEDQLARRSNIEDDLEEVVETVDDLPAKIRETESYSERRKRMLDQSSFTQRLKWKFTGVPVETEDSEM